MKYLCYFYYIPDDTGYGVSCLNLPIGGFGESPEEAVEEMRQQFVQMVQHYNSIDEQVPWWQIDLPFWAYKYCIEVEV